ncbi:phosphatase PAP2 family protein [Thermococcus thermotolerans]|uniref:phosphatase PAP2 family protein n=1 Tax=Thermococcus thermotolerans TaxID=2969672 RepID=UPI0021585564|nr:phosphatase PAP2 family protein [Thermococcus thermotolerans]
MNLLQRRLHDPEVLIRLNAFFLSYFGWIAFGVLYGIIGRWSVDVTNEFLRLPLTSMEFVVGLVEFTKSIPLMYSFFTTVYYLGFTGSIALAVAYLLLYKGDLAASDELFIRYLAAYITAGAVYLVVHVYAPHIVYNLPGYNSSNTLLTRQEFVLPSLHNTIVTINIITVWKYRKNLGGKAIILVNTLIPFATLFLGHHWIYDVLAGIALGVLMSRVTEGKGTRIPETLYNLEIASLRKVTVVNFLLAVLVLIVAASPDRWLGIINGLLPGP